MITTVLTLILVNTVNLESIATAGSAGFILVFTIVNSAGFRMSGKIAAKKVFPVIGFLLGIASLLTVVVQQFFRNTPEIILTFSIIGICFFERIYFQEN